MTKKMVVLIIIVAVVVVGLIMGGYFLLKSKKVNDIFKNIGDAGQKALDAATRGTLPSFSTNPLEDKPDINPADAGNPIKNIKTNPFE